MTKENIQEVFEKEMGRSDPLEIKVALAIGVMGGLAIAGITTIVINKVRNKIQ